MTRDELIDKINSTIDDSIDKINGSTITIQKDVYNELANIVRDLDYDGNNIKISVKNLRTIGELTNKLRKIILTNDYQDQVKEFLKTFNEVTTLQNQYMRQLTADFKFNAVLQQIKEQSIDSTLKSLTEEGLQTYIVKPIQDILRVNITTGGSFRQLMEQVRATVSPSDGLGVIERNIKQITTDALNQYSRNYLQTATAGTSFVWYQYTGSNIQTTRCFCHAMTEKRYFHIKEIPALLKGDFEEFEERDCKIYDRTDLPDGLIAGTNASNFLTFLGGYNCNHRAIPIPDALVPISVREALYEKFPSERPKD